MAAGNLDVAEDSHLLRTQAKLQATRVGTADSQSKFNGFGEVLDSNSGHNLPLRRAAPSHLTSVITFAGSTDSAGIGIGWHFSPPPRLDSTV